jgi:hypothetical protein
VSNRPKKNIGTLVRLNAALSMPKLFPGMDMLIPVVLEDGNLGSINIQVKNYMDPISDIAKIKNKLIYELATPGIRRLNMIIGVGPYVREKFDIHLDAL